jgi:hypothetical protein
MSFDWNQQASEAGKAGGTTAEKIPPGQCEVQIKRVVCGNKDGKPFMRPDNTTRQILIIFSDPQDREAAPYYDLDGDFAKFFAELVAAAGLDTKKMTEKGITPDKFLEADFATKNLVGRRFRADVSYTRAKVGNKEYARIRPLRAPGGAKDEDDLSV